MTLWSWTILEKLAICVNKITTQHPENFETSLKFSFSYHPIKKNQHGIEPVKLTQGLRHQLLKSLRVFARPKKVIQRDFIFSPLGDSIHIHFPFVCVKLNLKFPPAFCKLCSLECFENSRHRMFLTVEKDLVYMHTQKDLFLASHGP